jgi:hypothetical protein
MRQKSCVTGRAAPNGAVASGIAISSAQYCCLLVQRLCAIIDYATARQIVEENTLMKLTPPTQIVFWISVALGVLGLLGALGVVSALAGFAFWFAFVGLALLVLGLLLKGF